MRAPADRATTAALSLILALGEWPPDTERPDAGRSHALLRRRIFTTEPLERLTTDAVAVAARRVTHVPPPPGAGGPGGRDLGPLLASAHDRLESAVVDLPRLADAAALIDHEPRIAGRLATRDRPLLAAAVAPDGSVLHATRNVAGRNRACHAELNLVVTWARRTGTGLPAGTRVWCSLQPCRMCAAALARGADGPIEVRYLRPDPGPLARNTALDALGWSRPADHRA